VIVKLLCVHNLKNVLYVNIYVHTMQFFGNIRNALIYIIGSVPNFLSNFIFYWSIRKVLLSCSFLSSYDVTYISSHQPGCLDTSSEQPRNSWRGQVESCDFSHVYLGILELSELFQTLVCINTRERK